MDFVQDKKEEFLKHYHQRSNVEATFGAIKQKFGGSVRSKKFVAQQNEVLNQHPTVCRARVNG